MVTMDGVLRRAEAAEEDWQDAERRIVLLEAIVREAQAHIDHLIKYTEPSWRAMGVVSWAQELPLRLDAPESASAPVQSPEGTS